MFFPWISCKSRKGIASFIVLLFTMAVPLAWAQETAPAPLTLTIEPNKRIFSSHEGLMVKFTLKAKDRAKICIEKDILSQLSLRISRSGEQLALQPLILKDNRELFRQHMKIRWLESGESLTFRANIKRLRFSNGENWEPGEYNISGSFGLCEQTPGTFYDPTEDEVPVKSKNTGWFMIMS